MSDRIARAFNSAWATGAVAQNIFKALIGFSMLVFFTDLSVMKFLVSYSALFCLVSVIGGFWFWTGSEWEVFPRISR